MPLGANLPKQGMIYLRKQYAGSLLTRTYWNYKDGKEIEPFRGLERIVELGCGEGITLEHMVRRFPQSLILGLDIEPENIQILKAHGLPVIQGDVRFPCFKSGSLDAVLLAEVLEHIRDSERLIRGIRQILRPNGVLVVVIPNEDFFYFARMLTFKFQEAGYDSGHVRKWSPGDVKKLLEGEGFKVLSGRNLPLGIWALSLHHLCIARRLP